MTYSRCHFDSLRFSWHCNNDIVRWLSKCQRLGVFDDGGGDDGPGMMDRGVMKEMMQRMMSDWLT